MRKRRISSAKRWRRADRSPGRGGSLRKSPPMRTMVATMTTTAMTPRGWRPVWIESSRVRLEGPPRADADAPRTGAPMEGSSGSLERQQRESSPRRSRADTPPAPAQSQSVPRPQPPPVPKVGDRAKPQATGPLTRGRVAASGKGETSHRSASPGTHQTGDAEPRPAPVREGPGALTRGGSRPAGRGTGRRAVLPVG